MLLLPLALHFSTHLLTARPTPPAHHHLWWPAAPHRLVAPPAHPTVARHATTAASSHHPHSPPPSRHPWSRQHPRRTTTPPPNTVPTTSPNSLFYLLRQWRNTGNPPHPKSPTLICLPAMQWRPRRYITPLILPLRSAATSSQSCRHRRWS